MDEFRTLLNRFWVRRSEDRELFYQLRRKLPAMRGVLREQFGWEVICTEEVIRLLKQPAKASPAFGIRSFTAVGDYSLLCGLLLVLEDTITPAIRTSFLAWIVKANANASKRARTEYGQGYTLCCRPGETCVLHCTDGDLTMPAYCLIFDEDTHDG